MIEGYGLLTLYVDHAAGKRTFSSLMTKVKAKMQELNAQNQGSQPNRQTNWGEGMVGSQAPPAQSPPASQPQAQAQPQYYDPTPISLSDNRTTGVQGYDTTVAPATAPSPAAAQPQSQSQSRLSTEVGRKSGDAQLSTSPSRVDPSA